MGVPWRQPRRCFMLLLAVISVCSLGFVFFMYPNTNLSTPITLDLPTSAQYYDLQEVSSTSSAHHAVASDTTKSLQETLMETVQREIPNIPVAYMEKYKNKKMYQKTNCARLPKMSTLEFSNYYWQSLFTSDRMFQFFNAYYDNRTAEDTPCVRIISMCNNVDPVDNYCQLWFEKSEQPIITKVKSYHYIWRKEWGMGKPGSFQPYLITCQLPAKHPHVPSAVSIVAKECDNATNLLKVVYDKVETKKDFAVCVKGLDFADTDISVRLVEWIELLSLLGNDMVYFYNLQVHPNVTKLLNHYQRANRVRVIPMTLAGTQPNHPILQHAFLKENIMKKRHNEVITYNDCFYRNMNSYKYVVVLDIDEVIMPVGNLTSWSQLIDAVTKEEKETTKKLHAAFYARNVYFLDNHLHDHTWFKDTPKYLHMLQHVYRSMNFTGPKEYVKSFFHTERTLLVHNHLPLACFGKYCYHPISTEFAHMQHYRSGCERSVKKKICQDLKDNSVIDTSIWKYKKDLITRSNRELHALGYTPASLAKYLDEYTN